MPTVTFIPVSTVGNPSGSTQQAVTVGGPPAPGAPPPPLPGTTAGTGVPYVWPPVQGGVNTVLTNDGSGNLSWVRPTSSSVTGSGVTGQVTFWGGASVLAGDPAFRWDNTNKRFGLGTSSPAALLSVGTASQFRVTTTGDLERVNNVPYAWPSGQGGVGTVLQNDGAGGLAWSASASGQPVGVYSCLAGLAVRDVVYLSSAATVTGASAVGAGTYPVIGMVIDKPSPTTATVLFLGEVAGFSGLVAGSTYWLGSTAGSISATPPGGSGNAAQAIGVAKTTTTLVLHISEVIFV